MAIRREKVTLTYDAAEWAEFNRRQRELFRRAGIASRRIKLHEATWEPHDWSDFD